MANYDEATTSSLEVLSINGRFSMVIVGSRT